MLDGRLRRLNIESNFTKEIHMAEKEAFPRIPEKSWWALREQFKKSVPTTVTPKYLATVLSPMTDKSAKANIFPYLIMLKLIDEKGKPTPRAVNWRDDTLYPKVCDEILKESYPKELIDACPGPDPDKAVVQRWFATTLGLGDDASGRLASFYILMISKRIGSTQKTPKVKAKAATSAIKRPTAKDSKEEAKALEVHSPKANRPSVHIDLQVHISPDSTPELVDKIFESIHKHLYGGE